MTSSTLENPAPPATAESLRSVRERRLELRRGLPAKWIDGQLQRAARGRGISNRILAFYLDELHESGKHQDLGYRCVAQYAAQRLGLEPRRARELCCAGRALSVLRRVDRAFLDGRLTWTETELLTHGIQEHEQDEWIERASHVSCTELKQMMRRHRKGLRIEKSGDGGLPDAEFDVHTKLPGDAHDKLERVREELMRRRGCFVDDGEVIAHVLAEHALPERDTEIETKRAAAAENTATPEWLRRTILARDHHRCQACGADGPLHVHHIVFRSQGGLTRDDNLVTTCLACHGLIHSGRLFAHRGARSTVEFLNRDGEPLVAASRLGVDATPRVLEILCADAESGGQPPPCSDTTEGDEDLTAEWFLAHMHELEPGRDGVWRFKKARRAPRRVAK
jgi:HNH endonuclease